MTTEATNGADFPRFSDAEFARRRQVVREIMAEQGIEALLLYGALGLDNEVSYLSNFLVSREALLLFPTAPEMGEPLLFVQYYNHVPTARRMAHQCAVRWGGEDIALTAAEAARKRGLTSARLGYAGPLTARHYLALRRALPQATLVDCSAALRQLRLVKSEEELAYLRRGAELTDLAAIALERHARPGMTEHELIALIEGAYTPEGGWTGIHYLATTPMEHPSRCVPAQRPTNRRIEAGDVLVFEISAQYHGYPGQLLRPFAIAAEPTPAYQRMYDVAVEVFEAIAAVVRDGASSEEVLDAAERIHAAGYTIYDDLLHGLGGGYLPPILRTRQTSATTPAPFTFAENMTVVIQPNVITPDEQSGVQVGELVRVTQTGIERLHSYPMRFTRCG
ncbi:MAG TPA: Xaa-Pro peptidase family protein [Ktedonobacterales bacterium]|jgi:Xaa-Pro aminopeptidase|nr:Xaa-Pro peptidase family protein [Ktedonobacterales bacterium]